MSNNSQNQGSGLFGTLYEGSSSLGTFRADLNMILGIIVAVIIIIIGIYLILFNDDNKFMTITGTVINPQCTSRTQYNSNGTKRIENDCIVTVNYVVNGKKYSKKMDIDSSINYMTGDKVQLSVNKTDYTDVKLKTISEGVLGWGSLSCALFLIAICYLNYYLTHRYKFYAAFQGAEMVTDMFR